MRMRTNINQWGCLRLCMRFFCLFLGMATVSSLSMNDQHQHQHQPSTMLRTIQSQTPTRTRRQIISQSFAFFSSSYVFGESSDALALEDNNNAVATENVPQENTRNIYQLMSGVKFRDVRIGAGPPITTSNEIDTIVLHLRALKRDGSILFDTKLDQDGSPILYKLDSVKDYDYFGGDSSKRSKVTQGVEDAMLSRGSATWTETSNNGGGDDGNTLQRRKVEPMRLGGIRKVVVPSSLAYSHAGVSRYDAFRMGLRSPVPRDELMSYEIELLRCVSVPIETPTKETVPNSDSDSSPVATVQACCTEENYPCKTDVDPTKN